MIWSVKRFNFVDYVGLADGLFFHCDQQEELLSLKDIDKSLAVFCLATYGEGDPTDNCMELYDWIQNNDVDFSGLNYAVSLS